MEDIKGGAFQVARQLFSSELWTNKPSSWKVIWIYILGKVNHKDNRNFKRGEGFINLSQECSLIGCDITIDMIKHSMVYFRACKMISTKRSTRGTIIKVLNYDRYQTLDSYTSTKPSTSKAREKHERSTTINKNDKNEKNTTTVQAPNEIQQILDIFYKSINPTINFGNKTNRKSGEDLIRKFGLEKTVRLTEYAVSVFGKDYAPIITTTYQLKEKLPQLMNYYNKNKKSEKDTMHFAI